MLASVTSMRSGWREFSEKSGLPQRPQNDRVPWSDERWRISVEASWSRSWPLSTANQVTNAAPLLRRHIEQWQWPQNSVGSSISKRTAPQKQEPLTVGWSLKHASFYSARTPAWGCRSSLRRSGMLPSDLVQ